LIKLFDSIKEYQVISNKFSKSFWKKKIAYLIWQN
jgi:hypothetical protein